MAVAIRKFAGVLTLVVVLTAGIPAAFSAQPTATSTPQSLTREQLETQVKEKAKQLDEINRQMETTKQNLKGTTEEKLTLQKQLNAIQGNINQLNLSIKSDQVTVQKLNLEVGALNYDIRDIQASASDKKAAVEKLLLELQKNDRLEGNLLVVFLRNESLASGVLEAQTMKNLQNQLAIDIVSLAGLSDEYNNKIREASGKKDDIAFHQKSLTDKKSIAEDQKTEQQQILKETKNKESIFQQQLSELEKQQQQIADEVEALDAVLRTKIDPSLLPALRPGVLAMPAAATDKGDITQNYGATSFAQYAYRGKWHNGIDIGVSIGTPILAADDGEVVATGNQDAYCYKGAYGKFIVIKHGNNLTTLYAHFSKQVVVKGDIVKRGQLIGYSGKTGYATGPHLHFTVFATQTFYMGPSKVCGPMPYGGDLNPVGYL